MQYEKTFGRNLAKAIKNAGMRQQDLAEKLSVSQASITAYVTGRSYPSVSVLIQIAKVFDMSADKLLGLEEVKLDEPSKVEVCYCKDCRKHNKGVEDVRYYGDACPLVRYRGRAQGHEFDYQWCVYRERKA